MTNYYDNESNFLFTYEPSYFWGNLKQFPMDVQFFL